MKNNKWCVYKHTSPSGGIYIGITKQNPIVRWNNGFGYKITRKFLSLNIKTEVSVITF